jgi:hypothetical protein
MEKLAAGSLVSLMQDERRRLGMSDTLPRTSYCQGPDRRSRSAHREVMGAGIVSAPSTGFIATHPSTMMSRALRVLQICTRNRWPRSPARWSHARSTGRNLTGPSRRTSHRLDSGSEFPCSDPAHPRLDIICCQRRVRPRDKSSLLSRRMA